MNTLKNLLMMYQNGCKSKPENMKMIKLIKKGIKTDRGKYISDYTNSFREIRLVFVFV